jgi:hypothetical protein
VCGGEVILLLLFGKMCVFFLVFGKGGVIACGEMCGWVVIVNLGWKGRPRSDCGDLSETAIAIMASVQASYPHAPHPHADRVVVPVQPLPVLCVLVPRREGYWGWSMGLLWRHG